MVMAKLEQEIRFSVEDFRWAQLLATDINMLLKFELNPIGLKLYLYMFIKAVNAETVSLRDLCNDLKIHRRSVWLNKTELEKKGLLVIETEKDFLIWKIIPPSKKELGDIDITLRHSEDELGDIDITLRLPNSEPPNKDSIVEPIVGSSISNTCISNTRMSNTCISNVSISNVLTDKNENKPPQLSKKMTLKISDTEVIDEHLPYDCPLHVSVIWYWAAKRYQLHRLDVVINGALFGKMAKKYSHLLNTIGKDNWEEHKRYVDWYLTNTSDFIKHQCNYNFDYMASLNCYNKSIANPVEDYIVTDEERSQHKGVWIK